MPCPFRQVLMRGHMLPVSAQYSPGLTPALCAGSMFGWGSTLHSVQGELEECLLASVWVCVQHVYSLASICFYDCLPCACMWHIGFASTSTHTNRQWVRPPILPSCSVGSHSQICQASVDVSWMWHATHCKGETQIAKLFLRGVAQLGLKDGLKDSE